jgi:hypothetical protein
VIRDAARFDSAPMPFVLHARQFGRLDLERDVQVEVVLRLELERHVRGLEERERGAVVHAEEDVDRPGTAAGLGLADLEGVRQWQAEEVLVEPARLLGVAATVGVVVQSLDHAAPCVSCRPIIGAARLRSQAGSARRAPAHRPGALYSGRTTCPSSLSENGVKLVSRS